MMEVEENGSGSVPTTVSPSDWPDRWSSLSKILERRSQVNPDFEAGTEVLDFLLNSAKILVIGAGGLGCELLKDLTLMGFRNLDVIDMDTIDLSNLNRQFLFRQKDIGRSKAEVAADFINRRVKGSRVTGHFKKIQDFDQDFYRGFNIIVCGLDSIVARRWINGMLLSLLDYNEDGSVDVTTIRPMVDGGTEGFKGNARVIFPGMTACIECTLDLFPPQVNFPLCTIAQTPRLPEHCIEYVRILMWPKENPFGIDVPVDGDNPSHVNWIYDKSVERAEEFKIEGVTYRLTQGVIKRIIPAVASTNAIIAAICATETFKIATSCYSTMNNYMTFSNSDGLYTYTYEAEKKSDCLACANVPKSVEFSSYSKLQDVIDYFIESNEYQMKSPSITMPLGNEKRRSLYMRAPPQLEAQLRPNLKKTLAELEMKHGQELVVNDVTSPNPLLFNLRIK